MPLELQVKDNLCGYRAGRTFALARYAIDASIGVNNIFAVALAYSAHGASPCARAARNTFIGNLVCHIVVPPIFYSASITFIFAKVNFVNLIYSVRHCEHLIFRRRAVGFCVTVAFVVELAVAVLLVAAAVVTLSAVAVYGLLRRVVLISVALSAAVIAVAVAVIVKLILAVELVFVAVVPAVVATILAILILVSVLILVLILSAVAVAVAVVGSGLTVLLRLFLALFAAIATELVERVFAKLEVVVVAHSHSHFFGKRRDGRDRAAPAVGTSDRRAVLGTAAQNVLVNAGS